MSRLAAEICLLIGALFVFLAALGVFRFPDLLSRMHASSKSVSFGLGWILLGIAVAYPSVAVILKVTISILFIFLTLPVTAHLIGRSVVRRERR